MRFCRIEHKNEARYCAVEGDVARVLTSARFDAYETTGEAVPLSGAKLLAPCEPTKVVAIGVNYAEHASEVKKQATDYPLIFLKPASSVIGPGEAIIWPAQSKRVDYEAELGIVIKRRCKNVTIDAAMDYVLGFTCVNDVTARDLQSLDGQWTRAKGFDTFCPVGPFIDTEFDWRDARIWLELNGEVKQSGRTSAMIHKCDALVSFVSEIMTLEPGDIITTGTPSGIGPMKRGDRVKVVVEGLGELENEFR